MILGFLALYVALDRISFIHAFGPLGITPWSPPAGLSLALLLLLGLRYMPALAAAALLADLMVRGFPAPLLPTVASAAVIAIGYGGIALALSRTGFDPALRRVGDVFRLLLVAGLGASLVAVLYVGCFTLAGLVPVADYPSAALRFWVGDAIGIAIVTPLILLNWPIRGRFVTALRWPGLESWLQAASILLVLWLIFGLDWTDEFKFFYLLFLPLTWIAMRHGLPGVVPALVAAQAGLLLAVQSSGHATPTLIAFQLLMLALTATSLFLGAAISERGRAAAALRQSDATLRAIVNTAPDGIIAVGRNGIIASANPAAVRMFGNPAADLIGREVASMLPALQAPDGFAASHREIVGRRSDGSLFPIELAISGAADGDGDRDVWVLRDITERKHNETRLREHQADLAHVARLSLVGEMSSALAHELNQPLAAIVNYLRGCRLLLQQPDLDKPKLVAAIGETTQQAERAGEIIRRMREFTRKGVPLRCPVAVAPLVEDAMVLVAYDALRRGVTLRRASDPDLPKVMADRIQIEQVILNLLRNSLEAIEGAGMQNGEILVSAARLDADLVALTVRDNGPGIAPEIASRLFQPFATTKSSGMGLGLSLSRSIVEAHGGTLAALPAGATGMSFRFTLPVAGQEGGYDG